MHSRILSTALACVLTALLAACPRATPSTHADSKATASEEPTVMSTSKPKASASVTPSEAPRGKRSAGQENEPLRAYRAFGTEPFWSARVEDDMLVFSTPDDQEGRVMHGRRVPSLVGFVFVGKDGDKEFHLDISPGECNDGMSDYQYEYMSTFIYGDTTYKGCGEAAK